MKKLSNEMFSKMDEIENRCQILLRLKQQQMDRQKPSDRKVPWDQESLKRKRFGMGKKVKVLVDTPEKIWIALESHHHIEASILYLEAHSTQKEIASPTLSHGKHMNRDSEIDYLNSMPLLHQQWSTISQFPPKIIESCNSYLETIGLSSEQYSDALAASILLNGSSLSQSFDFFLNSRTKALTTLLNSSLSSYEHIQNQFCDIVDVVQSTISHLRNIFLFQADGNTRKARETPLLKELLEGIGKGELYFPIEIDDVKNRSWGWLQGCLVEIEQNSNGMLSKIQSAKLMKDLEFALLDKIHGKKEETKNKIRMSNSSSLVEDSEWERLCNQVCGRSLDLWFFFFNKIFLDRSKQIIFAFFQSLSITPLLRKQLEKLHNAKSEDKNMSTFVWKLSGTSSVQDEEKIETTKKKALGLTDHLEETIRSLHHQLSAIIADVNSLFTGVTKPDSNSEQLRQYLEDVCFQSFSSVAKDMEIAAGSSREDALFVGRLSRSIYHHNYSIEPLLRNSIYSLNSNLQAPSSSKKNSSLRSSIRNSSISAVPPFQSSELQKVLKLFKRLEAHSYSMWVEQLVENFSASLSQFLRNDNWKDPVRRKTWEESKVSVQSDEGNIVEESVFLPFQCSRYILDLFFNVCKEINKNGGNFIIDKFVIQYLVYKLSEASERVYAEFTSEKIEKNKEGSIQILYDALFVFAVFNCRKDAQNVQEQRELRKTLGKPEDTEDGDEFDEVVSWSNRTNKIFSTIKMELDPIEVAFYDPHVTQSAHRCFRKCSVLLGSLLQNNKLAPVPTPSKHKNGNEQHNILVLAPVSTRFSLLPISMGNPEIDISQSKTKEHPKKQETMSSNSTSKPSAGWFF
eukprot:TRINITY_DN3341_c0_g1_i1.p1 TRINITY_DN3341_c0_g1~~TRINITY_DN3341_c0_g1_i1.p1  ORF type:complete len:853 (-),score=124.12 TRINITY_DN3341_c0_g1_i1:466-3024(-)